MTNFTENDVGNYIENTYGEFDHKSLLDCVDLIKDLLNSDTSVEEVRETILLWKLKQATKPLYEEWKQHHQDETDMWLGLTFEDENNSQREIKFSVLDVNIYFYDTDDEGNFIDEFPNIAVYECRFDKDTGWETLTTNPPIISFNAEEFEEGSDE